MLALIATAVLAPLLYIPGYLLERALRGRAANPDPLERHYERTVLGALLAGWLALTLAELGVFALWLFLLLLALVCGAAALVAARRGAMPPRPLGIVARAAPRAWARPWAGWRDARLPLAVALALGALVVALVGRPFEVVLGVRDAGTYANTGFAIAQHGGIWQHDEVVAQIGADRTSADPAVAAGAAQAETNFLGKQNEDRFLLNGLRIAGFFFDREREAEGRVVPQGFHLFPAWIGLLASMLGKQGGLLAPGLLGLLGVWGVGMLGRRLAGPWVGLLAALLLALNGVQIWFSRYSTTETTAQFLTFAGLYAFAAMHQRQREGDAPFYGLLAGLALGQWALTRIEFVLVVGPALAYLLYCWLSRRWSHAHTALAASMGALLAQAALHIAFIARGYFFDTLFARLQDKSAILAYLTLPFLTENLRTIYQTTPRSLLRNPARLPMELAALVLLVVALVLLRRWQRPIVWFERLAARVSGWALALSAALIVLACGYAYLVRPQILTPAALAQLPGCLAQLRQPSGACLAIQGYIGAPIAPPTNPDPLAYALDTLQRLPRQPRLAALATVAAPQPAAVRDLPTMEGRPSPGAALDQIAAGEQVELLAQSKDGLSFLVRDARGVVGWADMVALGGPQQVTLPAQEDKILARLVNPRWATTLSPGNPSEAAKFAIYQGSFARFGWYLSPLGIALGVLGLALWWRRMRADSWLLLVVGGLSTYFFIQQAYGTDDQTYIYILRRFVPLGYPFFCLCIAYALVRLGGLAGRLRGWRASAARLLPAALALAMVGFMAATNLRLYAHTEYEGALDQIGELASSFGPDDIILMRGGAPVFSDARDMPDILGTPLIYAFDRHALTIKSQFPEKYGAALAGYIRHWQQQGRQVYLLLGPSGAVSLPGIGQQKVRSVQISLREFEQLTNQKPTNSYTQKLTYTIYRLTDSSPAPAQIGPADYAAQVGGFYQPEQIQGQTMAWTDGAATLRLRGQSGPLRLRLTLAPGERPASRGAAQVCLSYLVERAGDDPQARGPFTPIRCAELGATVGDVDVMVGDASTPAGDVLLRLESQPWVPARDTTTSGDGRSLGVLFGGLELLP